MNQKIELQKGERPIDLAIRIAGGTQDKLAKKTGLTQPCISKLFTGKSRRMGFDTVEKIHKELGIPRALLVPELFDIAS
jgi:transcriptional regulator with XRE-family HTH domain